MDNNNIELSSDYQTGDPEQESILRNEPIQNESEQGAEIEESEQVETEESGRVNNEEYSCDMSELMATVEVLQSDVKQLVSFVDSVRVSLTCVVFILLFVWAERKMKGAVIKMTGGKKNANID